MQRLNYNKTTLVGNWFEERYEPATAAEHQQYNISQLSQRGLRPTPIKVSDATTDYMSTTALNYQHRPTAPAQPTLKFISTERAQALAAQLPPQNTDTYSNTASNENHLYRHLVTEPALIHYDPKYATMTDAKSHTHRIHTQPPAAALHQHSDVMHRTQSLMNQFRVENGENLKPQQLNADYKATRLLNDTVKHSDGIWRDWQPTPASAAV